MTNIDIIAMAREAGAIPIHEKPKDVALVGIDAIERFAQLVAKKAVEAEREAIAAEFDRRAVYADGTPSSGWYEPDEPAQIVRARR